MASLIARGGQPGLRLEPFPLHYWINQLGVSGGQLDAEDEQVPSLRQPGLAAMLSGQRPNFNRIVADECRPDQGVFDQFLEQFQGDLTS